MGSFKILSKKFMLTLNIKKNFFLLVDLKNRVKKCGLSLHKGPVSERVIDFDSSVKGNRLVVLTEETLVEQNVGNFSHSRVDKSRPPHMLKKKAHKFIKVYRITPNQMELLSQVPMTVHSFSKIRFIYPESSHKKLSPFSAEHFLLASSDHLQINLLKKDRTILSYPGLEYVNYDGKLENLDIWRNFILITNDSNSL